MPVLVGGLLCCRRFPAARCPAPSARPGEFLVEKTALSASGRYACPSRPSARPGGRRTVRPFGAIPPTSLRSWAPPAHEPRAATPSGAHPGPGAKPAPAQCRPPAAARPRCFSRPPPGSGRRCPFRFPSALNLCSLHSSASSR